MPPLHSTVAIYGCGTIGASWAGFFAAQGLHVRLFDTSAQALETGHRRACEALDSLSAHDQCKASNTADARRRLVLAQDAQALLEGAGFIQESVLERYEIKREVHETIERHAAPDALIASSTSGLLASRMQEGLRHPERFLVGSDTWIDARWDSYGSLMTEYRGWLAQLPREVAEKIAYRNAERLFRK